MAKKMRKVLERLDALERLARQSINNDHCGHGGRGPRRDHGDHDHHDHHDDCGDHRGHCEFDEKRVIDTVTRLVTERVGRIIQKEAQKHQGGGDRHDERRDDHCRDDRGGDERRDDRGGDRDRRVDGGGGGDRDRRVDGGGGGDRDRRVDWGRGDGPGRNGGGERRMVDLLVGLISEHVQEIVATELDSRLGPPRVDSEDVPEEPRKATPKRKPAESE